MMKSNVQLHRLQVPFEQVPPGRSSSLAPVASLFYVMG
jgi:hypothetical protein